MGSIPHGRSPKCKAKPQTAHGEHTPRAQSQMQSKTANRTRGAYPTGAVPNAKQNRILRLQAPLTAPRTFMTTPMTSIPSINILMQTPISCLHLDFGPPQHEAQSPRAPPLLHTAPLFLFLPLNTATLNVNNVNVHLKFLELKTRNLPK